jgi:hypothetical protein
MESSPRSTTRSLRRSDERQVKLSFKYHPGA